MRVVFCINTLATLGGIEAITITKANALSQNPDNSIWIITCCDDSIQTCIPVSDKVRIIGIKAQTSWNFPWNLFQFTSIWVWLRKELINVFSQIQPDIVITTGGFDKWIIPTIKGRWSKIREIHGEKRYRKRNAHSIIQKVFASIAEFLDYGFNICHFDRIILLTQEDKLTNWNNNDKVRVIPNPIRMTQHQASNWSKKRIIAVGRLVYQKNYSSLLRVFAKVLKLYPDWRLDIYGDGGDHDALLTEIDALGISSSTYLMGNSNTLEEEMQNSSLFVSTSRFEGLSLAMLEAMSCGLPVVSYTYPCGPKDVIQDGVNGYLIPMGDEELMAEKICTLLNDYNLREQMGKAALERSKDFSIDHICEMWEDLFQQLRKES